MTKPNIIAFSGAHGTGKTTSVYEFAAKAKKTCIGNVGVLMEVARDCKLPIIGKDSVMASTEAQNWIFGTQLQREIDLSHVNQWLISDRTIVDCIAYTVFSGHVSLADAMMGMARQLVHRYSCIFFKPIDSNPYCKPDGIRCTSPGVRQSIETILLNLYQELHVDLALYSPGQIPNAMMETL